MSLPSWTTVAIGVGLPLIACLVLLISRFRRQRARKLSEAAAAAARAAAEQARAAAAEKARAVAASPEGKAAAAAAEKARIQHQADVAAIQSSIKTGLCPKCGQAAFTGAEVFVHSLSLAGGGGGMVYDLSGRCTACNHSPLIRIMR